MSARAQHKRSMGQGYGISHFSRPLTQWMFFLAIVCVVMVSIEGCSVYLASHQPDKKDLNVLERGTPRQDVEAELGSPISLEDRNNDTVEIYKFKQGYSKSVKLGRTLFHAIADVASIGVWEIPGTLIEKVGLRGTDMTAKVSYDAEGRVQTSKLFDATKLGQEALEARKGTRKGTIGVVVRPTAPDALLRIPAKGWLADAGRGAAGGAGIGAIPGALCLPFFPFPPSCLAGMGGAAIGSVVGSIYGAAKAESTSSWEQPESAFQGALDDLKIQEAVRDRVIQNARELTPNSITLLTNQELTAAEIEHSYPILDSKGVNAVVDLSDVTVELRAADLVVNPSRKLFLTVWCRLIRTVDGAELDSRLITDEMGGTRSVAKWADQNAQAFREEVTQAAQRLAQQVVKELLSDTPSPDDVQTPASQVLSR
jgi:hypothetical protein